jgi:Transcriptional regulatory protein, C terminal
MQEIGMQENVPSEQDLVSLNNPFNMLDLSDSIIGHVSGRSTDIGQIISSPQNAIVLAGAPSIGKSTLLRYLQLQPGTGWSWRNELLGLIDHQKINSTHFVQIDLAHLEGIEDKNDLLNAFINRCTAALYCAYKQEKPPSDNMGLKKLVEMLREISQDSPKARYFLMLDAIERLGRFGLSSFAQPSKAQEPQEYGLALLDHSNAIRTIVELIGEFRVLGFILSIESLPRSKVVDQFRHISADLARFTTMTLQTFTWQDTEKFLAQEPDNFDQQFAAVFEHLRINCIYSTQEQQWLWQQAGTHPYLLQQLCFYAFHLKQEQLKVTGQWAELNVVGQQQLIDWINGFLSTFFSNTWNRLQEAMQSDPQTRAKTISDFQEFIEIVDESPRDGVIPPESWGGWGPEFRYILSNEGIVRYDPLPSQPPQIHIPGELLSRYLVRKAHEIGTPVTSYPSPNLVAGRGYWLNIIRGAQKERLSLSELEYHLFKTLLQHPENCTDNELMFATWGKTIEKQALNQRMYHLRKKLRDRCRMEIIENRYGGLYKLNHPEWFQLE